MADGPFPSALGLQRASGPMQHSFSEPTRVSKYCCDSGLDTLTAVAGAWMPLGHLCPDDLGEPSTSNTL